jgi:hypothetical protein
MVLMMLSGAWLLQSKANLAGTARALIGPMLNKAACMLAIVLRSRRCTIAALHLARLIAGVIE